MIYFNKLLAEGFKSQSQIARVLSEDWVLNHGYCPNCLSTLKQSVANSKVLDFLCTRCTNQFELKSKKGNLGKKINDGAYDSMMHRIRETQSPNFFFLSYTKNYLVKDLIVVPSRFFYPSLIEKRKPLPITAKRAGWIGCNILLNQLPEVGKINLVKNSEIISRDTVQNLWKKTVFLEDKKNIESLGWMLDLIKCIEQLRKPQFSLADVYQFENKLRELHPNNRHVKEKIRQQLQFLRDNSYLEFLGNGRYALTGQ